MKLKVLFIVVIVTAILAIGNAFFILSHNEAQWYNFSLIVLVLALVIGVFLLLRSLSRMVGVLDTGLDLLKDQDYGSRLKTVGHDKVDEIISLFNRMMDTIKKERLKVREQHQFLDLLIDSSPMGVIILDYDNKILSLNPAARKIFLPREHTSPILGMRVEQFPYQIAKELSTLGRNESKILRLNDGAVYKCTKSSFMNMGASQSFYLIEVMTKEVLITERKAYEQVIRMISHEVNNSMAGISSSIDTIRFCTEDILQSAEVDEVSDILEVASDRCVNLSRFITRFAEVVKIPEPNRMDIVLNDFVEKQLLFMERMTHHKCINFRLDLCAQSPVIAIDVVLMEQVLLNIVKNAVESIPAGQHGEIVIQTTPRGMVISNNGDPISDSARSMLFTPFFSTKPNGQGVGLMLIREILTKHQFRFSLHTDSLAITHFHIYF